MCGIVGAIAKNDVVPFLLEGLSRLEYRGYDSAGIVVADGMLHRLRTTGRVSELSKLVDSGKTSGLTGIAHTRWATHGVPSERNAHPHFSGDQKKIAVVHNGIIENHETLRQRLQQDGFEFLSDTDTEVIAHLISSYLCKTNDLLEAVCRSLDELQGAYAIAVMEESRQDRIIVARNGAPLLLGIDDDGIYAASDASALVQVTQRIVYLEEGDVAELSSDGYRILNCLDSVNGYEVTRKITESSLTRDAVELGPYSHFMQKEIFEQPVAVANTLEMVLNAQSVSPQLFGSEAQSILAQTQGVLILACGTSYHAGLVAKYWLETIARLPCNVEIASEYRYRDPIADPTTLVVGISQSGETADTLAALSYAKSLGHRYSLAICNVPESALIRQTDLRFLTRAGPEIGVASTKAFTTQLAALLLFTAVLTKIRDQLSTGDEQKMIAALRHLPVAIQHALQCEPEIRKWAGDFSQKHHALFLGRGVHYPIALEGALKLKEISYIHAEAYAAGELKHGPLALVDSGMPVVAIAPNDALLEKLKSNLHEVRARGGELYVFADADSRIEESEGVHIIRLAEHSGVLSPILHTIPLQLLAYHVALQKGTDVDKPRNLAKSVTVE
ncbi:MAG TPA: glutamine--fructose-6-phosphate transaminase (isomerizing) [Nitrosomonas europaea]|uniref:Glutamine--fructose-6-phosphate aminotransferase [isomerizing] n=1 Tax=Nitrosomonas europaea (strain ATCC 19718 / CIP 103999 / KCTC 2705 / NBRC 14298) TaxID=228410 RepID=Q820D3_NITEU|nr:MULTISPECIES: glutamine--fructose-6-phosphate transaminase (isomerizing) [Nitrosomonas]CAD84120.1 Glutamine amidotransferase class-II:SIS domain [Nitrosomonas europaea ATCC 19718]SDW51347.1 glutamine--fructose-6-phosphate transaminase [Nitrosomonas europaea]SET13282.1 glutamine--fructose-6-phosphate transaminase [Nitrosomonas europaea]SJZ69195.1 glutamine--fructose-6-phosphate transaminase [Nitrosomonas europaea]HBF26051.1 glutamine--fructose-6-phosphate transaminase (isomerizing) [Nitrosom